MNIEQLGERILLKLLPHAVYRHLPPRKRQTQ